MLKRLVGFVWLILLLLTAFAGAWLVVDNSQLIDFHLFGWVIRGQSAGLLVVITFAIGLLTGLLGSVVMTSWMTLKLRRLQKQLEKEEGKGRTAITVPTGKVV